MAAPAPTGDRRAVFRRLGLLSAVAMVAVLLATLVTWPHVGTLAAHDPKTTAFIERFRRHHPDQPVSWQWVPSSRIASTLKRAVLVSEDINFFSHHGFEVDEMKKAVAEAIKEGEPPRGASTITQQLAKNLWLSPSRNPLRKLKEAVLTVELEHDLSKQRILELYLNVVELGPGIFGAEAASRHYFGISASDLSEAQAAALAAGLPKPSSWHPGSSSRVYHRRVARILDRMERATFLRREVGP